MPVPQKADPVKFCQACGVQLTRTRFKSGRLEDRTVFLKRHHCSQRCANTKPMVQADTFRYHARKLKARKSCEECGSKTRLHVHHKDKNPANNSPSNLQVLCASCHLTLHWSEERGSRLERRSLGVSMAQQLGAGKLSLAEKRRLLPNPAHAANRGLARRSANS